ncbi:MAG: hypothetical protein ABIH03_04405 [Pseudomonadota bacterium]
MRLPGKRFLNTGLLLVLLVTITLYQSEIGGPESVWNAVAVAAGAVFVVSNLRLSRSFIGLFAIPVCLLALSVIANAPEVQASGIRSAVATSVGFGLFALPPVTLHHRLLRRLVIVYVLACLGLSIKIYFERPVAAANANFNINPNSAAALFYLCAVLTLYFIDARIKWIIVIICGLLMVTTQARMGAVVFGATLIAYALVAHRKWLPRLGTVARRMLRVVPAALLCLIAIRALLPAYSDRLLERFRLVWDYESLFRNRLVIWDLGLRLSWESPRAAAFGHGPATISRLIGRGSHSSYLEAAGSYGYLFLFAALLTLVLWIRAVVRRGHPQILAVALPLMLYGVTETFLFSGVSMLWFLIALVGIYLHCNPPESNWSMDGTGTSRGHGPDYAPGGGAT